jgi:hypothetical protein
MRSACATSGLSLAARIANPPTPLRATLRERFLQRHYTV